MKKFFKNIKDSLRTMPLTMKSIFLIDFIGMIFILFFYLNLDFILNTENLIYLLVSLSLPLIFTFFKIYEPIVRHITFSDLKKTSYVFILWSIAFLIIFPNFKNPFFYLIFIYLFLIGYRLLIKDFFKENQDIVAKPIILYGAGELGIFTKRALYNSSRYSVKGFIDDNKENQIRLLYLLYCFSMSSSERNSSSSGSFSSKSIGSSWGSFRLGSGGNSASGGFGFAMFG